MTDHGTTDHGRSEQGRDTARGVPGAAAVDETCNVTVLDVPEWARFEIHVDGRLAGFAVYRINPGVITFVHTEIDRAYEGRGLGSILVRAALDTARARRLGVLPECPFVRRWISRHPDYVGLVPEAERARFRL